MFADDPALLAAFLDESRESLDGLEAKLVELDCAHDFRAAVDAIFRPVHTLKGNAPFFGFMEMQRLAHALETVLDRLRKGLLTLSQAIIDALLAGLDSLRACIDRIRANEPEVPDAAAFASLLRRLETIGAPPPPANPWARVFADLVDLEMHEDVLDPPTQARLATLRQDLAALRRATATATAPSPAQRTSDPTAAVRRLLAQPLSAPLDQAATDAVVAELKALRAACSEPPQVALLDELLATSQVFLGAVGFDDMLRKHVLEKLDLFTTIPTAALTRPEPARTPGDGSSRRTRPPETENIAKSMRVSEEAVDGFLAHVGDLLVIGDQLEHLQRRLATSRVEHELVRDMRQAVASFTVLSSELQRSIMAVRRVQVRSLLQKAPRLARDIATASGKDIAVVINGEGTEVDKGRLDLLDGPLTHIIRNCADHGIEDPAKRTAAGKPARGTITITAGSEDGWFNLEISDDGRGLDLDAVRRKGESLGLIAPGVVDEAAIIELIFASGLSTAAKVSDVSGRGVGMDVVKRQIMEAGGTVVVTTVRGKGTTFRLRLPSSVSTQIVPAFLVRDGSGIFALPLELVRESFVVDGAEGSGRDGVVLRHGAVMAVAPLGRILGQEAPGDVHEGRRTLVTLERNGATSAVSVDETLGVRRLVIRPLTGVAAGDLDGRFQGAALLGDGSMALVVDPERLLRLAEQARIHA